MCSSANGHIQATGLDARGRKQYRHHAKWPELRTHHPVRGRAARNARPVAADMKRDVAIDVPFDRERFQRADVVEMFMRQDDGGRPAAAAKAGLRC